MRILIVRNVCNIEEAIGKIDRALSRRGKVVLNSKKIGDDMVNITMLNLREGKIEDKTFVIRKMGNYTIKFMDVENMNFRK